MKIIGPFKQLLTLEKLPLRGPLGNDSLEIVADGGIVVHGGEILEVGTFSELATKYSNAERQQIEGDFVALPGFVDAHTHVCFGGSRHVDYAARNAGVSYLEIANNGGGIWDSVTKTREASSDHLLKQTLDRVVASARKGITTIEIKTGYGLSVEEELRMLAIIKEADRKSPVDVVSTCLAAHINPQDFGGDNDEYLSMLVSDLLPKISELQLSERVDIFVEESAFAVEEARKYLLKAKELGFQVCVHGDQFTTGGLQLAVDIGAMSVDHLEVSTAKEIEVIAKSQVVATVLPGASIGLGVGFAPARKLLDAGACVAIASDWNPGSAPMGDLLTQAAIMGTYEHLTDAEILAGMTFRAGSALGLSDRGRLRTGMMADFIAFEANDYREILYHQGQLKPSIVWKDGNQLD